MREGLFRGRRIDDGEWVYGDLLQSKYSSGDYKTSEVLARAKGEGYWWERLKP